MTKGGGQPPVARQIQTATERTFLGFPIVYSGMQDQDFGSVTLLIDCLIIYLELLDDLIYSGSELGQI